MRFIARCDLYSAKFTHIRFCAGLFPQASASVCHRPAQMFRACFGEPLLVGRDPHRAPVLKSTVDVPPSAPATEDSQSRSGAIASVCHTTMGPSGQAPNSQARGPSADLAPTPDGGQPRAGPLSAASAASARPNGASTTRTGLNASRIQNMDAENVTICDSRNIMDGLRLKQHELGRGTYGIVVPGELAAAQLVGALELFVKFAL